MPVGAVAPWSSEAARTAARRILAEHRFAPASVPHPLRGVLHAIGRALSPLLHDVGRLVHDVVAAIPGGPAVSWAALAVLVLILVALLSTQGVRRRLRAAAVAAVAAAPAAASRPRASALEREAEQAERDGRLNDAVRLRFQAGLLRLAERDLIPGPTATPSAQVARLLGSDSFDGLARRFDEIVYGGRPAGAEDVAASRREWPLVLAGARR